MSPSSPDHGKVEAVSGKEERGDLAAGDAAFRLYMRQLVEEARQDVREGRVFTQEEVEREAARWLEP